MVTVELAIGIITTALLAVILCGAVMVGVAHAAAGRTSSEVARQLARGDEAAAAKAQQEGPVGAKVSTRDVDDGVEVTVTTQFRVPLIGGIPVESTSWARYEWTAVP